MRPAARTFSKSKGVVICTSDYRMGLDGSCSKQRKPNGEPKNRLSSKKPHFAMQRLVLLACLLVVAVVANEYGYHEKVCLFLSV
jgi:hypothetical protein